MIRRPASLPQLASFANWAVVLGSILCCVGTAQAGVVGTWTLAADPLAGLNFTGDSGLNDPSQNWVAYNFSVASDDGALIQAIEVGLTGMFHQRWNTDLDLADTAATPSSSSLTSGDSHLILGSSALVASAAYEDNDVHNSNPHAGPLADTGTYHYGVGSALHSAWGIPLVDESTSLNVAHLVVPRGIDLSTYRFNIGVATATGIYDLRDCNFLAGSCSFDSRQAPPMVEVPVIPPLPTPPLPAPPPAAPNPPQHPAPAAPNLYAWATRLLTTMENPLPPGFAAYELNISSTNGSVIGAVDVRVDGPLHQKWADSDGDGIDDATPRGLAVAGSDSHLLIPQNGLPMQLNEDNGVTPSPLEGGASGVGIGSSLSGAWGIVNQTPTAQLAYLVVPESLDFHDLGISVESATSTGDRFVSLTAKNFNVLNPDGSVIRAAEPIIPVTSEPVPPTIDEIVNLPPIVSDPPGGAADPDILPPEDPIGDTGQITFYPYPTIITIDEASGEWIRVHAGFWNEILMPYDGTLTLDDSVSFYTFAGADLVSVSTGSIGWELTTAEHAPYSLQTALRTKLHGLQVANYVNFFADDSLDALRFGDFSMAAADSPIAQAPEPGCLALIGLALLGWLGFKRQR